MPVVRRMPIKFLSNIFNLQAETKAQLFATSRPIADIEKVFKGCLSREILASDEDVRRYLDGHILQLPTFVLSRPTLQEEIKTEIARAVEGMFLLAQLYLGSLEDKTTVKAVKVALQHFQKQAHGSGKSNKMEVLSLAYEQAIERINGQKAGFQLLAMKVLSWITCAKRPLTATELQQAIAIEDGDTELDKDNLPQIEDMVSVCAGLVTVDEESNTIRLVHYTAQEFFERTQKRWFPDAQTDIAKACITYLAFDVFESGFCPTDEAFKARLQENLFYAYAAQNLGYHANQASNVEDLVLNLFNRMANLSAYTQAMFVLQNSPVLSKYSQEFPRHVTEVHITAYLGLEKLMMILIENGVELEATADNGRAPLSWAAGSGHVGVVQLLLDTGKVDIDFKDKGGRTPLSWAAINRNKAVVEMLLDTGKVDVDSKDESGRTPLSWAAIKGNKAVVEMLLATDSVNPNTKDNMGRSPLFYAATNNHQTVVKLFLTNHGVDINSKDIYDSTPLSIAVRNGLDEVVKLLLAMDGVDYYSTDKLGRTPLSWATEKGKSSTVQLLLEKQREVDTAASMCDLPAEIRAGHQQGIDLVILAATTLAPPEHSCLSCDICLSRILDVETHYHCRACQSGDFDICQDCLTRGAHCLDLLHKLDGRTFVDGNWVYLS